MKCSSLGASTRTNVAERWRKKSRVAVSAGPKPNADSEIESQGGKGLGHRTSDRVPKNHVSSVKTTAIVEAEVRRASRRHTEFPAKAKIP
jgi:hypothetical protein